MGSKERTYAMGMTWALVLGGLYLTSLYSYLLFHTLAEVFSAAVALAIFMLVWNVRRSLDNAYLMFVGVAYLFIGGLDLVNTLAYKGMGIFRGYDENLPTQLWIGAQYMESLSLLVAPFFLGKELNLKVVFAGYVVAVSLLLGTIFYWDVYPTCFVAGEGLTPFKNLSEYVIGVILLASIALLVKKRHLFDPTVLRWLVSSITLTILSELCFAIYVDVYGFANLLGHFLKILAFYCIYKAIIEKGMAKPFDVLFRNLKESEESLKRAHDELERRVEKRTAELVKANEQLAQEIEERKQAEKDLQLERHKLKGILEAMGDGVYIANQQYDIEYANPAIEKEFGPVKGRKCYEYFHDRKDDCPWCKSQEVFSGKSVQWEWHSSKTGKTYDLFDAPVPNADGTVSRMEIFHDITGRKQAEEALRASEMKYRIVADNTYDWEWWRDPEGKFVYVSPSCEKVTDYKGEDFAADPDLLFRIIHADDRPSFISHMMEVEETHSSGEIEFRILRPDGSIRWIAHACQPVFDEQARFLGRRGSNRDITERKKAKDALRESEKQLRLLSSQLLTAQETERRRISRELHDDLGGTLAVLKLRSSFIEKNLQKDQAELREEFKQNLEHIDQLIDNVDRLSRDLSPSILDDFGFTPALRRLIDNFIKNYHVKAASDIVDVDHLFPRDSQIMVYRIFQEALTNIGKHAQAKNVSVKVRKDDRRISFSVEDDGKGFDVKLAAMTEASERGLGLATMDERARMLGGSLDLRSEEGKGTRITLSIPVKKGESL